MGRPRISGTLAAWAGTGGRSGLLWVLWPQPCSPRWQAAPECFFSWPSLQGKLLYCHPPPGTDAKLFQRGLEQLHPSKGAAAQRNGQQLPGRGPKAKQMEDPMDLAFFHQVRQGEASGGLAPPCSGGGGGASPNTAAFRIWSTANGQDD